VGRLSDALVRVLEKAVHMDINGLPTHDIMHIELHPGMFCQLQTEMAHHFQANPPGRPGLLDSVGFWGSIPIIVNPRIVDMKSVLVTTREADMPKGMLVSTLYKLPDVPEPKEEPRKPTGTSWDRILNPDFLK
jgi:hypothetical protein